MGASWRVVWFGLVWFDLDWFWSGGEVAIVVSLRQVKHLAQGAATRQGRKIDLFSPPQGPLKSSRNFILNIIYHMFVRPGFYLWK